MSFPDLASSDEAARGSARKALLSALVRALVTRRGLPELEPYIAPHHTLRIPMPAFQPPQGFRGLRELALVLSRAVSDVEIVEEALMAAGSMAVVRLRAKARQTGPLGVVKVTGETIEITGMLQVAFSPDGDDIVETWGQFNLLGILEQLGAVKLRDVVAITAY